MLTKTSLLTPCCDCSERLTARDTTFGTNGELDGFIASGLEFRVLNGYDQNHLIRTGLTRVPWFCPYQGQICFAGAGSIHIGGRISYKQAFQMSLFEIKISYLVPLIAVVFVVVVGCYLASVLQEEDHQYVIVILGLIVPLVIVAVGVEVSFRKLGYNVIASLAVSLIGLGGLELSESVHDPHEGICNSDKLSSILRIMPKSVIFHLYSSISWPDTSSGLSSGVSDAGFPSEKVVASGVYAIVSGVRVTQFRGNGLLRCRRVKSLLGMRGSRGGLPALGSCQARC
ncbi:hypothetical protein Tco_0624076 [Tanacetum coccineum]|uniref:Uncharacterized protein n=1 Tax=Tanacetum coccineum TaxID=301880 RepID=A0ABQ4WD17_9ASTR